MNFLESLKPYWYVVCRSKALKQKPRTFTLLGTHGVLFRTQGKVAALLDQCPHRNAPLSGGKVRDENIECPYHGWQFNAQGFCQRIPGLCAEIPYTDQVLPVFQTFENAGFIWVALNTPQSTAPYQPEHLLSSKMNSFFWQTSIQATLENSIENFLDGTHTHFVHAGVIRRDKNRQRIYATIKKGEQGIEIEYSEEGKQNGIISRFFEKERSASFGRFLIPSIAEIEYRSTQKTTFIVTAYFTPISEKQQHVYAVLSIPKGKIPKLLQQMVLTPLFSLVLRQDKNILEMQQKNIARFSQEKMLSTEVDLIRPFLRQIFQGKDLDVSNPKTTSISLEL